MRSFSSLSDKQCWCTVHNNNDNNNNINNNNNNNNNNSNANNNKDVRESGFVQPILTASVCGGVDGGGGGSACALY